MEHPRIGLSVSSSCILGCENSKLEVTYRRIDSASRVDWSGKGNVSSSRASLISFPASRVFGMAGCEIRRCHEDHLDRRLAVNESSAQPSDPAQASNVAPGTRGLRPEHATFIAASCPACHAPLKVAAGSIGRTGRCPKCGQVVCPQPIEVPSPTTESPAHAKSKNPDQVATATDSGLSPEHALALRQTLASRKWIMFASAWTFASFGAALVLSALCATRLIDGLFSRADTGTQWVLALFLVGGLGSSTVLWFAARDCWRNRTWAPLTMLVLLSIGEVTWLISLIALGAERNMPPEARTMGLYSTGYIMLVNLPFLWLYRQAYIHMRLLRQAPAWCLDLVMCNDSKEAPRANSVKPEPASNAEALPPDPAAREIPRWLTIGLVMAGVLVVAGTLVWGLPSSPRLVSSGASSSNARVTVSTGVDPLTGVASGGTIGIYRSGGQPAPRRAIAEDNGEAERTVKVLSSKTVLVEMSGTHHLAKSDATTASFTLKRSSSPSSYFGVFLKCSRIGGLTPQTTKRPRVLINGKQADITVLCDWEIGAGQWSGSDLGQCSIEPLTLATESESVNPQHVDRKGQGMTVAFRLVLSTEQLGDDFSNEHPARLRIESLFDLPPFEVDVYPPDVATPSNSKLPRPVGVAAQQTSPPRPGPPARPVLADLMGKWTSGQCDLTVGENGECFFAGSFPIGGGLTRYLYSVAQISQTATACELSLQGNGYPLELLPGRQTLILRIGDSSITLRRAATENDVKAPADTKPLDSPEIKTTIDPSTHAVKLRYNPKDFRGGRATKQDLVVVLVSDQNATWKTLVENSDVRGFLEGSRESRTHIAELASGVDVNYFLLPSDGGNTGVGCSSTSSTPAWAQQFEFTEHAGWFRQLIQKYDGKLRFHIQVIRDTGSALQPMSAVSVEDVDLRVPSSPSKKK